MLPSLFYQYRPAPPLDRFIDRMWYWEGEPTSHGKDRIMPDGGGSLIINMAEDEVRNYGGSDDEQLERYPGAVLVGAQADRRSHCFIPRRAAGFLTTRLSRFALTLSACSDPVARPHH